MILHNLRSGINPVKAKGRNNFSCEPRQLERRKQRRNRDCRTRIWRNDSDSNFHCSVALPLFWRGGDAAHDVLTMCSLCRPLKINPPAPKMPQRGSLAVEQTSELTNRGTVSLSRGWQGMIEKQGPFGQTSASGKNHPFSSIFIKYLKGLGSGASSVGMIIQWRMVKTMFLKLLERFRLWGQQSLNDNLMEHGHKPCVFF